jgi:drug/metabolite transporter (DMT)-like permease
MTSTDRPYRLLAHPSPRAARDLGDERGSPALGGPQNTLGAQGAARAVPKQNVVSGPGERVRRLRRRRRLFREELAALGLLLLALAVTVGVLASQWLGGGTTTASSGLQPTYTTLVHIHHGGAT